MRNDLISRMTLMEEIEHSFILPILKMNLRPEHEAVLKIREIIMNMPAAFDKEKVKEQIQICRSKFECTCCPKNIGKHIPVSCDECMDTFAKVNIVIVEKGGIE